MKIKVVMPNGSTFEAENGITIDELRTLITGVGGVNVTGARAIEGVDPVTGQRTVSFTEPQGTRKGL
jgi:hypothetical protein